MIFVNYLKLISRMSFYAVAKGREPGIYNTWDDCKKVVNGFSGAVYKKFSTKEECLNFIKIKGNSKEATSTSTSSTAIQCSTKRKISLSTWVKTNSNKKLKLTEPHQLNGNKTSLIPKKYGSYTFLEDSHNYVHVFTDGSCEGNGQVNACAGLGVYFDENHPLNSAKPVNGPPTNNRGEIQASILAIKLAKENKIEKLCINTDSQFLINSITMWVKGWKKKGWKTSSGAPVKNKIDFEELDRILGKKDIEIKWQYVPAHTGVQGNEQADALARQGAMMYRELQKIK